MDQEDTLDFKGLMAMFQEEELILKQLKSRPALPDKPKSVPPPTSPSHFLPAGARPSLLTSINQTLDGKTVNAPKVVFKEDKKQSKTPLISKGKDKTEVKLKKAKDKTMKGSKEKLEEISEDLKPKKVKKLPQLPGASKGKTAELVPAAPPPTGTVSKKRGILDFMKSTKRNSAEVPEDQILDSPTLGITGPAPLIPVHVDYGVVAPDISAPRALLPNIPILPDSAAVMEITPPSTIPASPELTPPPTFVPDIPDLQVPTLEIETPLEMETPAVHISRTASQNEVIPNPPSDSPTPPPSLAISIPSPVAPTPPPSLPEPEIAAEACVEAVNISAVETPPPPPPGTDPPSIPSSPKAERPISALSALSRAEDMSPARKMSPVDQRIFNALEKARKKIGQPTNPTTSYSITTPSEERPPSPTISLPDIPPIDYEGKLNSLDHRQASPALEGITEEGSDPVPELLVVPPPPPKRLLPDPESLGVAPEKPHRPPSVNLREFIPPPPLEEIPAPPEFSEADPTDIPEFDDVTSDAYPPELQVPEWGDGDYTGPETPDQQNLPEFYSNGATPPEAEVHASPTFVDDHPDDRLSGFSFPVLQEAPGISAEGHNDVYESTENVYEDITTSSGKNKAKSDGGKKRKGPPKNPYAEAQQEINVEKIKTGRFGRNEKKAEGPDEKELKKKEKQRLEKEKKELKEKQEKEKKEQKEKEKKENEMKKKFKITGQEDAIYEATVTVATKGRKNDLSANSGDIISIISTTNCPKGKWLARDSSNNYGYVAVDHVELDIKEMLELGKKAAISRRGNNNNIVVSEEEVTSSGTRASNHYPLSAESFTDDSEEWTGDEEEPTSPPPDTADPLTPMGHNRTLSMPDMGNRDLSINHQHSQSDISGEGTHDKARHEALQKLATFFHAPKPAEPAPSIESETSPVLVEEEEDSLPEVTTLDFDHPDMIILPPPDMYADLTVE
ncbi:FYN-binding protein 1 isoform X2 [Gymnodraco acuticeps]|uniref:FYN-binding protein 1 isoform X2 n=1 Tax=Gymnodraco acuticeps TaxID=8218 RepID=A0A6P8VH91_GYMAC|nr:FYN-binding protein 1 isoform X2 [Gymnodraco acuticeps]XP_034085685.1 FYN-binding protein 1 isoform X2 [Gymnodraco acuticeps]